MGTVSVEDYHGGASVANLTGNVTLAWSRSDRVAYLNPTAGGHTVTLKASTSAEIPFGYYIWVVINGHATNSFTLADAEGDFSVTIAAGDGALISKYTNSGGNARFAVDKRAGL